MEDDEDWFGGHPIRHQSWVPSDRKGHRAPDQALRPRAERVLHVHTLHGGHEVIAAINGRQELERLAERRADLLLLDFTMPIMDRPALLQSDEATCAIPRHPGRGNELTPRKRRCGSRSRII